MRIPHLPRLAALLALTLTLLPASASAQDDSGAWLEAPLATWNQPGMAIPQTTQRPLDNPRCTATLRWVESEPDQALVDAGWSLTGSYQGGWNMLVILAASGYDGMCRPLGFQQFVFVNGVFAGTISPEPMDSRTSGAGGVTALHQGGLSARFVRYAPTDPLCCPSRGAVEVTYEVQSTPAGPVLVPTSTYTEPAPTS